MINNLIARNGFKKKIFRYNKLKSQTITMIWRIFSFLSKVDYVYYLRFYYVSQIYNNNDTRATSFNKIFYLISN